MPYLVSNHQAEEGGRKKLQMAKGKEGMRIGGMERSPRIKKKKKRRKEGNKRDGNLIN